MLTRRSSRLAALFLLLMPFVLEAGTVPRTVDANAAIEVPDFGAADPKYSVKLFTDWCREEGLMPVLYGSATGPHLTKYPTLGTVLENQALSPPGTKVDPRDSVHVVLEEVDVPPFTGKTAGFFRNWCRDWGMSWRFTTSSGNILINPPSEDIIADNETNGHVAVGTTVGVILDGPYFPTVAKVVFFAAVVLVLSVAISLMAGQYLRRDRVR